jgi:glutamate dehydrogenase/leucine dehydrogenase
MAFKDVPQDGYERVIHVTEDKSGLDAIIAIHNTKLGPAIGGIRLMEYQDTQEQIKDALRLAQGMTFKNAAAGLNHGGAKTTVNLKKIKDRKQAYFHLGRMINLLDGIYICAGDIGTTIEDLLNLNGGTSYVAGIKLDSSKPTALGVYTSIDALLDFNGKRISDSSFTIQGMGKVGKKLADTLLSRGADVRAYDPDDAIIASYDNSNFNITHLSAKDIFTDDSDMFVPCAMGGILNFRTLNTMTQKLVCGSANNQFDKMSDYAIADNLNIQYVPDFIANCGGVVAVAMDFQRKKSDFYLTHDLRDIVLDILDESQHRGVTTQRVAEDRANAKLRGQ